MDTRKAIAMIGHIREYIVDNQDDHEYAEPIDMAIEALKKLIPQTVESVGGIVDLCPLCQTDVKGKYCYNCGQKLNWKTTS